MLLITTIIYSFIQGVEVVVRDLSGKQQCCIEMQTVSPLEGCSVWEREGQKEHPPPPPPSPRPPPKMFPWILARICDASRAERLRRRMCDVGVAERKSDSHEDAI